MVVSCYVFTTEKEANKNRIDSEQWYIFAFEFMCRIFWNEKICPKLQNTWKLPVFRSLSKICIPTKVLHMKLFSYSISFPQFDFGSKECFQRITLKAHSNEYIGNDAESSFFVHSSWYVWYFYWIWTKFTVRIIHNIFIRLIKLDSIYRKKDDSFLWCLDNKLGFMRNNTRSIEGLIVKLAQNNENKYATKLESILSRRLHTGWRVARQHC